MVVQLITAPLTTAVDAVTYLWSALCLGRIRHREARPETALTDRHLIREIKEGVVLDVRLAQ